MPTKEVYKFLNGLAYYFFSMSLSVCYLTPKLTGNFEMNTLVNNLFISALKIQRSQELKNRARDKAPAGNTSITMYSHKQSIQDKQSVNAKHLASVLRAAHI